MNKTFTTMKADVGSNVQNTSTTVSTVIGRYINDIYTDILRRFNISIIDDDYTFTTTSGTQDYVLPDNFGKEVSVLDTTNAIQLERITINQHIDRNFANYSSSGVSTEYFILDKPVKSQPSSDSVLSVVSSSASDSTQTLYVRGISGGVEMTESISLSGTTPVSSSNSYSEIISLSKSSSTTGKLTVTSNSGSVTLAVIAPQIVDYKVKVIRFYLIPSSSVTISMPYYVNPQPLLNDYDTLLINADDIVEHGATAMTFKYLRQYQKAQEWERLYEKDLVNFVWSKENQPNQVHYMNPQPYSRETV